MKLHKPIQNSKDLLMAKIALKSKIHALESKGVDPLKFDFVTTKSAMTIGAFVFKYLLRKFKK